MHFSSPCLYLSSCNEDLNTHALTYMRTVTQDVLLVCMYTVRLPQAVISPTSVQTHTKAVYQPFEMERFVIKL